MTEFGERLERSKRDEARAKFSGYVQSVAFQMTLSRNMIEALQMVRDFGTPSGSVQIDGKYVEHASARVSSFSVPIVISLERRGLVWHDYIPPREAPKGHRYHKLTRAGELMCGLLVEAGLMPSAKPASQRKRA